MEDYKLGLTILNHFGIQPLGFVKCGSFKIFIFENEELRSAAMATLCTHLILKDVFFESKEYLLGTIREECKENIVWFEINPILKLMEDTAKKRQYPYK